MNCVYASDHSGGDISRRTFTSTIAALMAAPALHYLPEVIPGSKITGHETRQGDALSGQATAPYDRGIVIDCLASPTSFNVPWPPPGPLSKEQLDNIARSGITSVNVTVSARSFENTVRNIALLQGEVESHPDRLLLVRQSGDISLAKKEAKLGLILGFQEGEMIGRDLGLLDVFRKLGVRIIQPTYNVRNLLGDGCLEPGDAGLSELGRHAVQRMNELGLALDLSHCGIRTTADGIAVSSRPVLISHSGCRAVYDNPRNKYDRELRALADRGGVIGLYLMPYLGNDGKPYATKEMFIRHLKHAIDVCGEDHVGIGSDQSITPVVESPEYLKAWKEGGDLRKRLAFEAPDEAGRFPYIPELNSPRRLELIAAEMTKMGYSDSVVEKVIGANFERALRDIWTV
ncbi:MAG TPA: membrane dipeptidase [Blastocatellia bacterium]